MRFSRTLSCLGRSGRVSASTSRSGRGRAAAGGSGREAAAGGSGGRAQQPEDPSGEGRRHQIRAGECWHRQIGRGGGQRQIWAGGPMPSPMPARQALCAESGGRQRPLLTPFAAALRYLPPALALAAAARVSVVGASGVLVGRTATVRCPAPRSGRERQRGEEEKKMERREWERDRGEGREGGNY